ncbi:Adaptor for signal transduction [Puccinia graminis f. sp. tritici]|uniref:Adaptor for signal transduction n=1 Tax=Puccinia graminis f. sp. tritici TaxID=56615 RepID=A0A5B0Q5K9_PUCGR|nr:Adaptor for signal transduction [Puccinia graminis f. sp. tritici]
MRPSGESSQPMSTSSSSSNHADTYMPGTSINFFNTVTPVSDWSEEDVKGWLQAVGFDELAHVSEEQGIDGAVLIHLDSESLRDLGFVKVGQRLRLMRLINELMGLADNFDLADSNPKMIGDQINSECNLWNCFQTQNDRIRLLEDQVWNLKETTKFLRERTDSLSSFNTNWAMQSSCPNSLALQSSKPSADSGNSTPPTTASSIRTAITCLTSNNQNKASHDTTSNESDSAVEHYTPRFHDATEHPTCGLDRFTLASPIQSIKKNVSARDPSSPQNANDDPYTDTGSSSSNSRTPQPGVSPHNITFSPNTHSSKKPSGSNAFRNSQQSTRSLADLRRKFSGSNHDEFGSHHNPPATATGTGLPAARKPSLVTRRVGAPAQGIGSRSMRSGGALNENRAGGVWKRSSITTILSGLPDDIKPLSTSKPDLINPLSPTSINRSASTSNLKIANSSDPKSANRLKRVNTETSMRVKSNTEQTVIEVLSNHLSSFYADEPHAWSKHVLLLRINDVKEYCLSYDDIPLKVYRSFTSRDGVDFAIRSIDEIPSPLRLTGNSRKKNLSFDLEQKFAADDSKSPPDGEIRKAEVDTKPLTYGLAICGYQAEAPGELTIKAGESFKLKSHSKGRYYLERESNVLLGSPLLATNMTPSPSPTRFGTECSSENVGWVAESCILESTKSMRTLNANGSSLKHLISSPLDGASECFDLENLTSPKITLVSFQSQPTTWSGELNNVMQAEKIRVFNHKTRFHWVYCLRESSGERGWLPKWILSSNLQVFPDPHSPASHSKLQKYLLQQSSSRVGGGAGGGGKSTDSISELNSNRKAVMLGRSASTVSPQKQATNKAVDGSPTSMRALRTQRSQHFTPTTLAISIDPPPLKQIITRHRPDGSLATSEEGSDSGASLTRSVTDGSRTTHFTPRSRRSRASGTWDL